MLKKAVQSAPTKSIASETLEHMSAKLPPRLRGEAFKESSAELFAEVTADYEASMKRALGESSSSPLCSDHYELHRVSTVHYSLLASHTAQRALVRPPVKGLEDDDNAPMPLEAEYAILQLLLNFNSPLKRSKLENAIIRLGKYLRVYLYVRSTLHPVWTPGV